MELPLNAGATPVGLGARDTLRLEKGFLLSGVDFTSQSCLRQMTSLQEIHGNPMFRLVGIRPPIHWEE